MRALRTLFLLVALAAVAAAGWLWWFAHHAWAPREVPFEFTVEPRTAVKTLSHRLADQGLFPEGESFWIVARVFGGGRPVVQAGTYRLEGPVTPLDLLDKMRRGDVVMLGLQFIEGTTLRQWLAQLATEPRLKHTLKSDADVRGALGITQASAEGWLFPDTYHFAPGVTDADVLKHAHTAMRKRLDEAWQSRDPELPLADPYQALILASVVEKETGAASERPLVASVFVNRLRRGMRLQTDPTVIYGMGEAYDGNIRKKDLTTDTPWNTYTRDGLPPTPIAMPGAEAVRAAVHPAKSDFLYFVARGDGTHEFTKSLEEHNRAVAKWQLHR